MFVRCAYLEGTVEAGDRDRFAEIVTTRIAPAMRRFPGIRRLEIRWGREFEREDRGFYLCLEHTYDTLGAIAGAITSDVRAGIQADIDEAGALFRGRVYHVNYEVDGSDPG